MSDVDRTYTVKFNGRPSMKRIQEELELAAKSVNPYTRVAIQTNGSSDTELEEITFTMETER